jgi:RHS repeat-associated protein
MMPKMTRSASLRLYAAFSLLLLCATMALAQEEGPQQTGTQYDRGTPPQHAAGVSSLGSYISADLGTINLSNGALNFKLPLGSVGGRGFWLPLSLNYSSKVWSAGSGTDTKPDVEPTFPPRRPMTGSVVYAMYDAGADLIDEQTRVAPGWTIGAQPMLKAEIIGINPVPNDCRFYYKLTKLTLVLPDKGEIQLRDDMTNGAPLPVPASTQQGCAYRDGNRGQRWHATDGSGIVFISDDANGVVNGVLNGVVITADGMRYRFASIYSAPPLEPSGLAHCTSITDRNGNRVEITYPTGAEVRYTDQLGRVTTVVRQGPQLIVVTVPGYQGQSRAYKIKLGPMSQYFRSDEDPGAGIDVITGDLDAELLGRYDHPNPHIELFPSSWGAFKQQIDGRDVVSELELPDGRSLHFKYNKYGEVAEVVTPTGGKVEYDYAHVGSLPAGNTLSWEKATGAPLSSNVSEIDRALVKRRTYPDGSTLEAMWDYSYGPQSVSGTIYPSASVRAYSGDGTQPNSLLLDQRHYFLNGGRYLGHVNPRSNGTGYSWWSTGIEWRTETRDAAGAIISASEQDWSQRTPVVWTTGYGQEQPENDNRVNETRQILDNGLTAKSTTLYDQYNNLIEVKEFDFDGSLKRHTVNSYADSSTLINGLDYTKDEIHLLRLPKSQQIYDSSGTKSAETVYEYDNYNNDGNNLPLADYAAVSGHNSTFGPSKTTRGNLTGTSRWLYTPDVTGDSYLYVYSRYDTLGNIVSVKDARGYVSSISYADDFGDGSNPGSPTDNPAAPTYALPTLITSPLPQPSQPAHTARSQYDYSTGLLTGFRDRNGVVTQTIYQDAFNRPTLIKSALGIAGVENHAAMYYAPASVFNVSLSNNDVLTVKDLNTLDDKQLMSWTRTDGFGRTTESWQRDPQGDVKVETVYDALGRTSQTSNPFRPSQSETALFTRTAYDLAGRVLSVTTPDSAVVRTFYSGNQVTVEDQAHNKRRSITDALGRLIEVDEPDANNNLDGPTGTPVQPTLYAYDALSNLRTVTQGQQTRTFTYDSLKRLTSAFNPESGLVSYDYDQNGNLRRKTDARGIKTTYDYDALGRVTSRSYSNEPAQRQTPTVSYSYDTPGIAYAIGRLTAVTSSISRTNYAGFDALGRVTASSQRTDGQTYSLSYEYDLAGNLTREVYPTGRVITHSYDAAGRMQQVAGTKGTTTSRYASHLLYAAHGAVRQVTLGNNLVEQTSFNTRLQPTAIELGTAANPAEKLQLSYDYGTTTNNGNLIEQRIHVPGLEHPIIQHYEYDSLNRLTRARETVDSVQSWQQVYGYDRYGNRRLKTGTTLPASENIEQDAVQNPRINPANNRIESGQGYGYDYGISNQVGNLTTAPGYTYEYDAENRMIASNYTGLNQQPNPNTYSYDGDGRRVKKVSANGQEVTIFVYNAMGQLVAEYNNLPAVTTNETSYLTTDTLGTPRVITKADGSVKARHDYLPFGEEVGVGIGGRNSMLQYGAADAVRQKFTSYERDIEADLDYAQARYYSFKHGRFTAVDPLLASASRINPQSFNRYIYVLNNPLALVDRSGAFPEFSFSVYVRAFAPFHWFGPGGVAMGDGRGFSTDPGASYRIQAFSTVIAADDGRYFPMSRTEASPPTTSVTSLGVLDTCIGALPISWSADSECYINDPNGNYFPGGLQGGNDSLGYHMYGNDDAVPIISSDIDLHPQFRFNYDDQGNGIVNMTVTGAVTGDQFPAAEAFIRDTSGNSVMLGIFAPAASSGPVTSLPGNGTLPMINVNVTVRVNNGIFQGVVENGNVVSLEEYNRRFTSQPAVRANQ